MSLVKREDLTTLRTAEEALQTSTDADKDQQIMAVAYAINSAANTGETNTVYQGVLLDEVKEELTSKGYTFKNFGECYPENRTLISWKDSGAKQAASSDEQPAEEEANTDSAEEDEVAEESENTEEVESAGDK